MVLADIVLGIAFGLAQHCGVWEGLYYATATAVTAGADITPQGWLPHLLTVGIYCTVYPLLLSVFALITTGLTTDHMDARHDELKRAIQGDGELCLSG
jgi:hypothetical protein